MAQKTGALIFDETADRYDIRFDLNDYYGGLHCGDCFEVFVRGKWNPYATGHISQSLQKESTFLKRTGNFARWESLLLMIS